MKLNIRNTNLLGFFVLLLSLSAFAAERDNSCSGSLGGGQSPSRYQRVNDPRPKLLLSGRELEHEQKMLADYVELLFKEGGLLEKLGLSRAKQVIQFMPGTDLNAISANNRIPISFWLDGAQVLHAVQTGGSILEMVLPGNTTRHSIYRDDLPVKQQLSIINHVIGHVHFGVHTRFAQTRATENNQNSFSLNFRIEKYKETFGEEAVTEWLQYLHTLSYMQDLVLATHNTPEDFALGEKKVDPKTGRPMSPPPTPNILQAVVAMLPKETEAWKIDLAKNFESLNRYISGAIRTKYMNEGFASLMQEFLPSLAGVNTFDHAMEYCCLASGVIGRESLQNPYWLGVEGWRNLRKAFERRPEIRDLSPVEKAIKFVTYGTTEIIGKLDDIEFLRLSLTDDWINKNQFAITRKLEWPEYDPNLPPPQVPYKQPTQFEVHSRNPREVREEIIRSIKALELDFPRPLAHLNIAERGTGVFELELSDSVGRFVSLKKKSMVQSLIVLSRILRMPVSLESTFDYLEYEESVKDFLKLHPEYRWYFRPTVVVQKRIRVTARANGSVVAHRPVRKGSSSPKDMRVSLWQVAIDQPEEWVEDLELSKSLQGYSDAFLQDLDLGKAELSQSRMSAVSTAQSALTSAANAVSGRLMLNVPTLPHAVEAYWNYAQGRSVMALELAKSGQRPIVRNGKQVWVKILPDIPTFEFDKASKKRFRDLEDRRRLGFSESLKTQLAPSPLFASRVRRSGNSGVGNSTGPVRYTPLQVLLPTVLLDSVEESKISEGAKTLGVRRVGGGKGRRFWGEGDPKNGNGSGDGDEDEDGDSGDSPGDGDEAGEGGVDPSYLPFDLQSFLGGFIELPNLRPLDGQSREFDEVTEGWVRKRTGPVHKKIRDKALRLGLVHNRRAGITDESATQIMRKGFRLMKPKDRIVNDTEEEPTPDINAQITVMVDLSGSFLGFMNKAKQMVYDMSVLLQNKYNKIEISFVVFDGNALEVKGWEEFANIRLGGGTDYTVGMKKVLEVQERFPEGNWDRFTVIVGDMEDGRNEEVQAVFEALKKNSRFLASVRMAYYPAAPGGNAEIERLLIEGHESDPYMSFIDLAPENDYNPSVLKKIFKNAEK